jgi:hypothetical protein
MARPHSMIDITTFEGKISLRVQSRYDLARRAMMLSADMASKISGD